MNFFELHSVKAAVLIPSLLLYFSNLHFPEVFKLPVLLCDESSHRLEDFAVMAVAKILPIDPLAILQTFKIVAISAKGHLLTLPHHHTRPQPFHTP